MPNADLKRARHPPGRIKARAPSDHREFVARLQTVLGRDAEGMAEDSAGLQALADRQRPEPDALDVVTHSSSILLTLFK